MFESNQILHRSKSRKNQASLHQKFESSQILHKN